MSNQNPKSTISSTPKQKSPLMDYENKPQVQINASNLKNMNETTIDNSSTQLNDKDVKEQEIIIYEFHFPANLCGRLIGRQGVHVDYIRQMTQVDLVVRDDAVSFDKQVVALHGRRTDIEKAIELIAKRFPPERYPQVAFKPINKKIILRQRAPECVPLPSAVVQLYLPDGIPTDVLVTSVVSCNHLFVQQIYHSSYPELARLDNSMSVFYHHTEMTPLLPRPIQVGVICAAPTQAGWFRALVTIYNSNDDMAMIKFLDYGGYLYIHASTLRVLRQDFLVIPFQAVEVYLDNVVPPENQEDFTPESIETVKSTLLGASFHATVSGYHYDNIPYIQLTKRHGRSRWMNTEIQKMINPPHLQPQQTAPVSSTTNGPRSSINPFEQSASDLSTSNSDS